MEGPGRFYRSRKLFVGGIFLIRLKMALLDGHYLGWKKALEMTLLTGRAYTLQHRVADIARYFFKDHRSVIHQKLSKD